MATRNRSLRGIRQSDVPPADRTIEIVRRVCRLSPGSEDLVVALAKNLAIDALLLVPSRDESVVFERCHHLIKGRTALPNAGLLEPFTQVAAARRAGEDLDDHQELQMRDGRQRHCQ